jgi:hypothetical protein
MEACCEKRHDLLKPAEGFFSHALAIVSQRDQHLTQQAGQVLHAASG